MKILSRPLICMCPNSFLAKLILSELESKKKTGSTAAFILLEEKTKQELSNILLQAQKSDQVVINSRCECIENLLKILQRNRRCFSLFKEVIRLKAREVWDINLLNELLREYRIKLEKAFLSSKNTRPLQSSESSAYIEQKLEELKLYFGHAPFVHQSILRLKQRTVGDSFLELMGREEKCLAILEDILSHQTVIFCSEENFQKTVLREYFHRLKAEFLLPISEGIQKDFVFRESEIFIRKKIVELRRYLLQHAKATYEKKIPLYQRYRQTESIPQDVLDCKTSEKHTLAVEKYVSARLSRTIVELIKKTHELAFLKGSDEKGTDIFLGPLDDLKKYYYNLGYSLEGRLGTDSSNWFFLFTHKTEPKKKKIVIHRVANLSRLKQVLLQLKYSGIHPLQIGIKGTLANAAQSLRSALLEQMKIHRPHLVYIGARSQVLTHIATQLYPSEMANSQDDKRKTAEKLLARHDHKLISIEGIMTFSHLTLKTKEKGEQGIIALRMPNGDLAYEAVKAALEQGAKYIIMVGVGGALRGHTPGIGSYHLINASIRSSISGETEVRTPSSHILNLEAPGLNFNQWTTNFTIDSPLLETQKWYEGLLQRQTVSCVDVETFHILRAFSEYLLQPNANQDVRILPGLFISDIIGEAPLNDKIDDEKALVRLPGLIQACLDKAGFLGPSVEEMRVLHPVLNRLDELKKGYIEQQQRNKNTVDLAFYGQTVEERTKGAAILHHLKKNFASDLFTKILVPAVRIIMGRYNDNRSFDEAALIFGFNRLFTRDYSSAGTDIDFMLLMDTKNMRIIEEVRRFITLHIRPFTRSMGIDIETADYLITTTADHIKQLAHIRSALLP